jgi:tetratricopeptide (TPR) repeat protein
LRPDSDQFGRSRSLAALGNLALERFDEARAAGEAESVLRERLNAALGYNQEALALTPVGDHQDRAIIEHQLGSIYHKAGDTGLALRHYQQALQHDEARGDIYGAGQTRYSIALLLAEASRVSDALHYARAALRNFQQAEPGAAAVARTKRLIADLEQPSH